MGGTFDPIHNGHLVAASEVAGLFELDQVVFVPTGQPWQKRTRTVTAAEDRYLMTVIATASNPRFSVSRVDIDRGGPTYTKDTLRDLHTLNPDADLYFITGADALASILSWQNWEEMFEIARFVGVSRPGYELDGKHISAAMAELPARLPQPGRGARTGDLVDRLPEPCRGGRPIWYLVPDGVVQYVAKRGLYREQSLATEGDPIMTAIPEAIDMATVAAQAAADKLADESSSSTCRANWSSPTASSSRRRPTSGRSTPSSTRSRRRCAPPGTNRPAARAPAKAAGRCSTTSTSWCTSSIRTNATSMRWTGCGATARDGSGGIRRSRGGVRSERSADWCMLRHGQTEYNAGSRMQGQLDTDLSDLGREQAIAAAEVLAKRQPLLIVSSDLRRALDTATRSASGRDCRCASTPGCAKRISATGRG